MKAVIMKRPTYTNEVIIIENIISIIAFIDMIDIHFIENGFEKNRMFNLVDHHIVFSKQEKENEYESDLWEFSEFEVHASEFVAKLESR